MKTIRLYEVPSELGAGTRGASLGIEALKVASLNAESTFFRDHQSVEIPVENYSLFHDVKTPSAKRIEELVKVYRNVRDGLQDGLKDMGVLPFVLAGDHSTAGGTIAAIRKACPNEKLGVIWIDAHADLHTPYTTPSGNIHGMPLAAALGEDNMECKANDVLDETRTYWDELKTLSQGGAAFEAEDIVFIALRDFEDPEDQFIKRKGIRNITTEEVRSNGAEWAVNQALERLHNCSILYVSFDVDSMDSEIVGMGTGTPVPNGLTPEESKIMLSNLICHPKVVCMEMVEVNPCLDTKNKMANIAFDILEDVVEAFENHIE